MPVDSTGRQIRRLRKAQGLTLGQLCARSGTDISFLSRLERGLHPDVRLGTLERLAKGLNVFVTELLSEGTAMPETGLLSVEKEAAQLEIDTLGI